MNKEKVIPVFLNSTTTSETPVFYDALGNTSASGKYLKGTDPLNIFPEQPLGNRVIVKPRQANTKYKRIESQIVGSNETFYKSDDSEILLDEGQLAKIIREIELTPQLVDVVGVGTLKETVLAPGDVIRVYLNHCSAKITLDEIDYLVYSEPNILTKVI